MLVKDYESDLVHYFVSYWQNSYRIYDLNVEKIKYIFIW